MKLKHILILACLFVISTGDTLRAVPQIFESDPVQGQREFYQKDVVQTVYLKISPADRSRMLEALPECVYVPASFQWRDIKLEKVTVRFKGNSSSDPRQMHKRSYLVRFDKYDDHKRFIGLRRVSFDNGVQFGSLFSEPIITEILQAEGIKTHRCNYAKLYVNSEYQGVYVNLERIDESFLDQHFPESEGGLWKNDEGGNGGDLRFIGEDPKQYEKAFEAKNNAAKNREQLVGFIRQINEIPDTDFLSMLESNIEVDTFFRITSVMLLSGAFDQLTGWGPHNFYLFHDTKQNRWHYLPWDLDVGFCEIAFNHVYVIDDWNAAWPVPVGRTNPLLDRIVADQTLLARYRVIAGEILEKHFEPNRLCHLIDKKYDLLKADLQIDPFPHQRATVPGDKNYDDIVNSMKAFMRKRYAVARQQLQNPGQRPKAVGRPGQGAQGIPPKLVARIQRLQQAAQDMQRKMQELQKIMQKIGMLIQQKKFDQANLVMDEAFKLTEPTDVSTDR
ncbi:CotH kinase family protein [Verrucomicrobia bacterium]|nr:CotH kinase family protein [Verrucomicrobiota bacterium]